MQLTLEEMETVIRYDRSSNECHISTTDSTVMTRLDKMPDAYQVKKEIVDDGKILEKHYTTNKDFISFRSGYKNRSG